MTRFFLLIAVALLPLVAEAGSPSPVGATRTRTFPYSMIGQLTFFGGDGYYVGSGTVVQPRGVLTAGHNLYDASGGWSTDLVFKRGHFNNTDLAVRYPTRIFVLAGYQASVATYGGDSVRSFARDTGGLSFRGRPVAGGYLGWSTDPALVTGKAAKVALGYGAVVHSGEEIVGVAAAPFVNVYSAFYESLGTDIEAGMSGGPLIATLPDGSPSVCGVVVSGSDQPVAGGIRLLNRTTAEFIVKYLSTAATP